MLRFLGLHHMPTVSIISRQLSKVNDRTIGGIKRLQQNLVIEALVRELLATSSLDFDGPVPGTCRHAEGMANVFNKKKVQELRSTARKTSLANAQVSSLRERLLKVAVWVQRSTRHVVLHLPDAAP